VVVYKFHIRDAVGEIKGVAGGISGSGIYPQNCNKYFSILVQQDILWTIALQRQNPNSSYKARKRTAERIENFIQTYSAKIRLN